jgi:hypothetical protein
MEVEVIAILILYFEPVVDVLPPGALELGALELGALEFGALEPDALPELGALLLEPDAPPLQAHSEKAIMTASTRARNLTFFFITFSAPFHL